MTKLRCFARREDVTAAAAATIGTLLRVKPDAAIGLATGRTQEPLFAELLRLHRNGQIFFRYARFFHLDEYLGLPASAPESMSGSLDRMFVGQADANPANFHRVDGTAQDPAKEAARYEDVIRAAGGIDLQILGMGTNGHIAFNEPGSPHNSRTRLVRLTPETVEANKDFFPQGAKVPDQAISMGIATILETKSVLMLVTGASKRKALQDALERPASVDCPASALRAHKDCTWICDNDAAAGLSPETRAQT
jgi:glucosamine-6-phosphate deaminase